MDALSTTEANSKKKMKDVEEAIFVSGLSHVILIFV